MQKYKDQFLLDKIAERYKETSDRKLILRVYKVLSRIKGEKRDFLFDIPDEIYFEIRKNQLLDISDKIASEVKIESDLIELAFDKFVEIIKEFRVKKMDNIETLKKNIDSYNLQILAKRRLSKEFGIRDKKRTINKNKIVSFVLASKNMSFQQTAKKLELSRTTTYEYLRDLDLLGYSKAARSSEVPECDLTYFKYYEEMIKNQNAYTFMKKIFG